MRYEHRMTSHYLVAKPGLPMQPGDAALFEQMSADGWKLIAVTEGQAMIHCFWRRRVEEQPKQ